MDWPRVQLVDGSSVAPEDWADASAIVVFWATWCAFCKRHNAHIDQLFRSLDGSGPHVLGVAMDGDVVAVRRYMQVNGYRFPVTLDKGMLRHRFTARSVIPMTCLVDRLGQVRQCIPGEMSESDVLGLRKALAT
jgi:thiol-disulfide isomerase/thioredoxin